MKLLFSSLLMITISGCVSRFSIATLPVVSMTDSIPAKGPAPKADKEVRVKYCLGEKPKVARSSTVGLIDEVTYKAQKQTKARYIKDANYTMENRLFGESCIFLEGTAWK